MSRRNTSKRPLEPPQDRSDRIRAGRIAPTGSARREKEASRPPMAGRGRGGGTRLARVDAAGGQRRRRVHPRRWTRRSIRCMSSRRIMHIIFRSLSLTSISLMLISSISISSNISIRIIMSILLLRSSLLLRSLSSMMILSSLGSLSSMTLGLVFRGCRRWCTRPARTAIQGGLLTSAFYLTLVDMWHEGYGSMPM